MRRPRLSSTGSTGLENVPQGPDSTGNRKTIVKLTPAQVRSTSSKSIVPGGESDAHERHAGRRKTAAKLVAPDAAAPNLASGGAGISSSPAAFSPVPEALMPAVPRVRADSGNRSGTSRLQKLNKANGGNWSNFRRAVERDSQGAPIHDAQFARFGVLISAIRPSTSSEAGGAWGEESQFANTLGSSQLAEDLGGFDSARSAPPGTPLTARESRPSTKQGLRQREAQRHLEQAQQKIEDPDFADGPGELFIPCADISVADIALQGYVKQSYWTDFKEAGSAKKTLSDFEMWQRVLHKGQHLASTAVPSSASTALPAPASTLESGVGSVTGGSEANGGAGAFSVNDSDWRTSHLGFTRRSNHEEYVSDYAQRCRARYALPLGPRGSTPRAKASKSPSEAPPLVFEPQQVQPGFLEYGGWGLGSEQLDMLCQATSNGPDCKHANLSGNRIEDKSVPLICQRWLATVEALDLSDNYIGPGGARHFADSLELTGSAPLLELNLQHNRLGHPHAKGGTDVRDRELSHFLEVLGFSCAQLRALSLAQNALGRIGPALGQALGSLVAGLKMLRVLDLHWNSFHGDGAHALLCGVYDNLTQGGKLSRLDLSWNRLGMLSSSGSSAKVPSKVLSDVLACDMTLLHLDISCNDLGLEDCARISAGLRSNSTLFGLHVAGNHARLDELGFLVPFAALPAAYSVPAQTGKEAASPPPILPPPGSVGLERIAEVSADRIYPLQGLTSFPVLEQGSTSYAFRDGRQPRPHAHSVAPPPPAGKAGRTYTRSKTKAANSESDSVWEEWDRRRHNISLTTSFQSHPLGTTSLRTESCWLCDNWESVKLVWTPAISGRLLANEIQCVHAFMGSDKFARPTLLQRVEDGQSVRFVGFRMVPPRLVGAEPLSVVFRVNGMMEIARDLPVRLLSSVATVSPISELDLAVHSGLPVEAPAKAAVAAASPESLRGPFEIVADTRTFYVNELPRAALRPGRPRIVISEASVEGGEVEVYPRSMQGKEVVETGWDVSSSIFASWKEWDDSLLDRMLTNDLRFCRIQKFAGEQNLADIKKEVLPFYAKLITIYRNLSVFGERHHVFGTSLHSLQTMCHKYEVFDRALPPEHLSSLAFAAHAVDRKSADEIKVASDSLLVRYQFVETMLRIAESKYMRVSKAETLSEAASMLLAKVTPQSDDLFLQRQRFREDMMVEEVDLVLKANVPLLKMVFDMYAGCVHPPGNMIYAGTKVKLMTLPDWYELLDDIQCWDDQFVRRKGALAFSMASTWQVDEVTNGRHMQLSFVEFLMALGAVVFLSEYYRPQEFADLIEEFLNDNLAPIVAEHESKSGNSSLKSVQKAMKALFRRGDDDSSGTLSAREFGRMMREPDTTKILGRHFSPTEVLGIFGVIDQDQSGQLSFQEVMTGVNAMEKMAQNEPRLKAFMRKGLSGGEAEGAAGLASAILLVQFLSNGSSQRKLMRVGVETSRLKHIVLGDVLELSLGSKSYGKLELALDGCFSSSALDRDKALEAFATQLKSEDLDRRSCGVEDFMRLILKARRPVVVPRWKILLKQVFEEADADQCGSLSQEEFRAALKAPGTRARFSQIGLEADAVEDLFAMMDTDGSNEITESELLQGIGKMLEISGGGRPPSRQKTRTVVSR